MVVTNAVYLYYLLGALPSLLSILFYVIKHCTLFRNKIAKALDHLFKLLYLHTMIMTIWIPQLAAGTSSPYFRLGNFELTLIDFSQDTRRVSQFLTDFILFIDIRSVQNHTNFSQAYLI